MDYGKIITHKSYFNGQLKSEKTEYSIPKLIQDKNHAITEIIDCLSLISDHRTTKVEIIVEADPKTYKMKLITKKYIIDKQ
jgi:hypothetical protein